MYVNYTFLRLLLPFLCITVYNADAQGFINFPAGNTISPPGGTIVSTDGNEIEVDLVMNGATTTKVSEITIINKLSRYGLVLSTPPHVVRIIVVCCHHNCHHSRSA